MPAHGLDAQLAGQRPHTGAHQGRLNQPAPACLLSLDERGEDTRNSGYSGERIA